MRLSVDLSVDTARDAVRRLLAARHDCCVRLSYRIVATSRTGERWPASSKYDNLYSPKHNR